MIYDIALYGIRCMGMIYDTPHLLPKLIKTTPSPLNS